MKQGNPRKEKSRIVLWLLLILILALLNNHFSRQHYNELDKNMSSIYQDRLMPTSYLFRLSDHLYQKKLLLQDKELENAALQRQLLTHNNSVLEIIDDYEKTFLTENEKEFWSGFRSNLNDYNKAEEEYLRTMQATPNNALVLHHSFDKAMLSLNHLNVLQTNEGLKLQTDSKAIIGNTVLRAYLEVSLLFILGIVALRTLTNYERVLYPAMGGNMMN